MNQQSQDAVFLQFLRCLREGRPSVYVSSEVLISRIGRKSYDNLKAAVDLCPWMKRSRGYAPGKRSKLWVFDIGAMCRASGISLTSKRKNPSTRKGATSYWSPGNAVLFHRLVRLLARLARASARVQRPYLRAVSSACMPPARVPRVVFGHVSWAVRWFWGQGVRSLLGLPCFTHSAYSKTTQSSIPFPSKRSRAGPITSLSSKTSDSFADGDEWLDSWLKPEDEAPLFPGDPPAWKRFSGYPWFGWMVDVLRDIVVPDIGPEGVRAQADADGKDFDSCWATYVRSLSDASFFCWNDWRQRVPEGGAGRKLIHRDDRDFGRLYHPLVSLSRHVRRRIRFSRGEFGAVSDLSSTYWCIVASKTDPGPDRDRMISMLQEGRFYEELNEGIPDPSQRILDRGQLKIKTMVNCMFGDCADKWPNNHLWESLKRLVPSIADRVLGWRKTLGRTGMAQMLNRAEGRIFIDDAFRHLSQSGIPAITLHDGIMAPRSYAKELQQIVELYCRKGLGFDGCVKTTDYGVVI